MAPQSIEGRNGLLLNDRQVLAIFSTFLTRRFDSTQSPCQKRHYFSGLFQV
jgi:hypothetical protein